MKNEKKKSESHFHAFKLNEEDNNVFLKLFNRSGIKNKSKFITSILFNRPLKVIQVDKTGLDFCAQLTDFYNQYQKIGVNYNQVVRKINASLNKENAEYYVAILKETTIELVAVSEQIFKLSKAFERRWLQK